MNYFTRVLLVLVLLYPVIIVRSQPSGKTYKYWDANRVYTYMVKYIDSSGKILTNEVFSISPTEKVWKVDVNQTLIKFRLNYKTADSLRLAPYPLNGVLRPWQSEYHEGAIENEVRVWMHPLRENQYDLTEIAPFPEVRFPLVVNKKWEGKLWIYKAFGSFEGTVDYEYRIADIVSKSYGFGIYKCWQITATGKHSKLGESTVVYYFNEELGFTEMHYSFYNKQKIIIVLLELTKT